MTNVEKAREIVDKIVRASNERTELNDYHDVKQSALEMADWIIDNVVFDKFGRSINIENFRKAMEE